MQSGQQEPKLVGQVIGPLYEYDSRWMIVKTPIGGGGYIDKDGVEHELMISLSANFGDVVIDVKGGPSYLFRIDEVVHSVVHHASGDTVEETKLCPHTAHGNPLQDATLTETKGESNGSQA